MIYSNKIFSISSIMLAIATTSLLTGCVPNNTTALSKQSFNYNQAHTAQTAQAQMMHQQHVEQHLRDQQHQQIHEQNVQIHQQDVQQSIMHAVPMGITFEKERNL